MTDNAKMVNNVSLCEINLLCWFKLLNLPFTGACSVAKLLGTSLPSGWLAYQAPCIHACN